MIELNLKTQKVLFWLNGRYLKKERVKKLPQPGLAWRPYIKFAEKDFVVILNPFCKSPPSLPNLVEQRSRLPDNLFNDLEHSQVSYLESVIGNVLMVLRLPK
jgi:hypothetical protein